MRIAVEVRFDEETSQWCVGMVAPPWIASCGRTRQEARRKFLEAFRAFFEAPRKTTNKVNQTGKIELLTVA